MMSTYRVMRTMDKCWATIDMPPADGYARAVWVVAYTQRGVWYHVAMRGARTVGCGCVRDIAATTNMRGRMWACMRARATWRAGDAHTICSRAIPHVSVRGMSRTNPAKLVYMGYSIYMIETSS